MSDEANLENGADYRVLARKYRPQKFGDLIGQYALVRTLSNALEQGRLAHAFVLTGVRGVGKTTTARIIAKGLNCTGPDGTGGPTVEPCGVCETCIAIADDRHVDVIEMDAASRTGVDDIREIIDGVRYRPVAARYKVYIIDEVHMLSRNAFNALLKTLEEPPDHVKFVFATTEIRKVPITVLSRCQRFDLRRISTEDLIGLFQSVTMKEGVEARDEALRLVARASDGSARDGLSLLDQAIGLATGPITHDLVQDMLGLADKAEVLDLFEELLSGKLPNALQRTQAMHTLGADPLSIAQDLLETTHLVTRLKVAPGKAGRDVSELERTRCAKMATALSMPHLGRAWQMLLKGITEIQTAPFPLAALEMVLIRLAHLSDFPSPAQMIRAIEKDANGPPSPVATTSVEPTPITAQSVNVGLTEAPSKTILEPDLAPNPMTFEELVALFEARREPVLHARLVQDVRPVKVSNGQLQIAAGPGIDDSLAKALAESLSTWTGQHWTITLVDEPGSETLAEQRVITEAQAKKDATSDPVVAAVLDHFPGASVEAVRPLAGVEDIAVGPEISLNEDVDNNADEDSVDAPTKGLEVRANRV